MTDEERIDKLSEKVCDLTFDLEKAKKNELIYKDIIANIELSVKDILKRDEENQRFKLGENIDFKSAVVNLKSSIDEYKRVYKINF
jgi:hypothetical protein